MSPSTRSTRPLAQGLDREIGSVETGKLADLVLWEPAFFGVKPHLVIKGGQIAYAQMGDANASIPTPQPVLPRPMFGAIGRAPAANSFNFVAQLAIDDGLPERLGWASSSSRSSRPAAVTKADMRENDARAGRTDRPRQLRRHIDGELVEATPAAELPMAQRYFLF